MSGISRRKSVVGALGVSLLTAAVFASSAIAAPLEVRIDERISPPDTGSELSIDVRTLTGDTSDHDIAVESAGAAATVRVSDTQGISINRTGDELRECTQSNPTTVLCNFNEFAAHTYTMLGFALGSGDDQIRNTNDLPGSAPVLGTIRAQMGAGNDVYRLVAPSTTYDTSVWGDEGNDLLQSSPSAVDGLDGGLGHDTVSYDAHNLGVDIDLRRSRYTAQGAMGESDYLADFESLIGGDGPDRLLGTEGPNAIAGGDQSDIIEGFGDDDTLGGGNGPDHIHGDGGNDTISGGAWLDTLYGDEGDDELYGNADGDILVGGLGADFLQGGLGSDYLQGNNAPSDAVGDSPDDVVSFEDLPQPVNAELGELGFAQSGADRDTLYETVETYIGTQLSDTIKGSENPDNVYAGDGDDVIKGEGGDDFVKGEGDDDTIRPGFGDDDVIGGDGSDTVSYSDRTNPVTAVLDASAFTSNNGESGEDDKISADTENLTGGSGNDSLRGSDVENIISAGDGDDDVQAVDSIHDFVYCGNGTDNAIADAVDTLFDCELPATGGPTGPVGPTGPTGPNGPDNNPPTNGQGTGGGTNGQGSGPKSCTAVAAGKNGIIQGARLSRILRLRFKLTAKTFAPGKPITISLYFPGSKKKQKRQLKELKKLVKRITFRNGSTAVATFTAKKRTITLQTTGLKAGKTKLTARVDRKKQTKRRGKRNLNIDLGLTCK